MSARKSTSLSFVPPIRRFSSTRSCTSSGGVVAAFECKTTLRTIHLKKALKTSAALKRALSAGDGTPYRELNAEIIYGVLAHSHDAGQKPVENIERTVHRWDAAWAKHPRECIDVVTVADLATWHVSKMTYVGPGLSTWNASMTSTYGPRGSAMTSPFASPERQQARLNVLSTWNITCRALHVRLAWDYPDMRHL